MEVKLGHLAVPTRRLGGGGGAGGGAPGGPPRGGSRGGKGGLKSAVVPNSQRNFWPKNPPLPPLIYIAFTKWGRGCVCVCVTQSPKAI